MEENGTLNADQRLARTKIKENLLEMDAMEKASLGDKNVSLLA